MIPKYEKIKQEILKEIHNGIFLPGDKIYSEDELKTKFKVSSTTVVKALNDLVRDGYLIRRQGRGTFVRKNLFNRPMYMSEKTLVNSDTKKSNEILETFTFDDVECDDMLHILGKGKLFKVTQISLIDFFPWKIHIRYVLSDQLENNSKIRIQNGSSLSEELGYTDNLINFPADMDISAELINAHHAAIADLPDEIKEYIGEEKRAVLKISRVIKNAQDKPIEFDIRFISSKYYKLSINSKHH